MVPKRSNIADLKRYLKRFHNDQPPKSKAEKLWTSSVTIIFQDLSGNLGRFRNSQHKDFQILHQDIINGFILMNKPSTHLPGGIRKPISGNVSIFQQHFADDIQMQLPTSLLIKVSANFQGI